MTPDRKSFNLLVESWPVSDAVKDAFMQIDRSEFVPPSIMSDHSEKIYTDSVIPFRGQSSMSQPSLMALMTEYLSLQKGMKVLEIGTASGYQARIIGHIIGESGFVNTVEYNQLLATNSRNLLNRQGLKNIKVHTGDGLVALPDQEPTDRIITTAAAKMIPKVWKDQLLTEGVLVVPVGFDPQHARLIRGVKNNKGEIDESDKGPVRFVPIQSEKEGGFSSLDLQKLFRAKYALLTERAILVAMNPLDYVMQCAEARNMNYEDYVNGIKIPEERFAELSQHNPFRMS